MSGKAVITFILGLVLIWLTYDEYYKGYLAPMFANDTSSTSTQGVLNKTGIGGSALNDLRTLANVAGGYGVGG